MGIARYLNRICSVAVKLALMVLAVCAPIHVVQAQQSLGSIAITGGNNQSASYYSFLPSPLTVTYSGSSYASLDWTVVSGSADIYDSQYYNYGSSYSDSFVTSSSSINLSFTGTAGPVKVTVTCTSGCDTQQTVTFTETATRPPPQLQMQYVSGSGQSGSPNSRLAQPLVVRLIPDTSSYYEGPCTVPLEWSVQSGTATFAESGTRNFRQNVDIPGCTGGTDYSKAKPGQAESRHLLSATALAQAVANAQVNLDLGATPGEVEVRVSCSDCDAGGTKGFIETITANGEASLVKISGDNQTGVVGSAADAPLMVQAGNTPGQTIQWTLISGQATLSAASSITDANGQASISFTYGSTAGPVVIEASVATSKVDFNATALAAAALAGSGDNQVGIVGTKLQPFVVQVAASPAKGLSQIPVTWSVVSGGGTLTSTTTVTDANGRSSNTLTLGATVGANTVTATLPGNVVVDFSATAVAAGSVTIGKAGGDNQIAGPGSSLQPFVVDVQGAPGVSVEWMVTQGGGTLAATSTVTDSSGKTSNTLTLGPNAGINTVQAMIPGAGSVTFTAIASATAGSGSQFTIVSGNNQTLTPNTPSQPLVVKLVDGQGQPIADAAVQWSVSGSSGSLTSTDTLTGADGQSHNALTVILPGDYSVTAKLSASPDVPALTFSFSNGVANMPNLSPTQLGVANAVDKACPALAGIPSDQLSPAQKDLLLRCSEIVVGSGSDPQDVPNALNQITNNKVLPQRSMAQGVQTSQFGNLNTRLAELRQGVQGVSIRGLTFVNDGQSLPLAMLGDMFRKDPKQSDEVGKDFDRWGFFATGMVVRGGFDANITRPGFDFHNASLTAGVDYRFSDTFVAGVALGINKNQSSLDQDLGKLDVDGTSLNGYFTWYHGDSFYIEGSAVLDWLSYDLKRNIAYQIADLSGGGTTSINQTASASPDGHQSSVAMSLGKDFNRGAWAVSPYLRGVYSHLNLSSFREKASDPNAPGAGLVTSVESRSLTSVLGVLGARASYTTSYDWGVLIPNATLEWNHEFRNDPQTIVTRFIADPTQTPIVITDQAPDQSYFNVGLGLNAVFPQGRSGFITWEHLVGFSGVHENRYSLGIRIEF